jgi:hypothetical protein
VNHIYYLTRVQFFSVLGAVTLLATLVWLIRRKKLLVEYSILWLGIFVVFTLIAIFGGFLGRVSAFFGILYPPAALFIILLTGVFLLLLYFSVVISELKKKLNDLAVYNAMLDEKLRSIVGEKGGSSPPGGSS